MAVHRTMMPKFAFSLLVGKLYIFFAVLEAIAATGASSPLFRILMVPGDPMGTFVLAVIGSVFLYGAYEIREGVDEGVAYLYVGIVLAMIFAVIYLLVLVSTAADSAVLGESYDPVEQVRPGLYLGLLALAGLVAWRDKFDIKGIRL